VNRLGTKELLEICDKQHNSREVKVEKVLKDIIDNTKLLHNTVKSIEGIPETRVGVYIDKPKLEEYSRQHPQLPIIEGTNYAG
jgi:hypothetical protein